MSILLSVVTAATFALPEPSGAVAETAPPVQTFAGPVRSRPILRLQPEASRWASDRPEGEIRLRVTLPTAAETPTPVTVRLHWTDRVKGVNNAAWDRDEDFIRGAQH